MRRLGSLLALALLLGSIVSCGDGDRRSDAGASATSRRIIVQASGGESEIKALEQLADEFERVTPGTTVEVIGVASQGDHMARLSTAFAGGAPPDVFLLNYRRFGQFAAKGVIEPAVLETLDVNDFFGPPVEAFSSGGRLLCLPQNISSTVTYFNPNLFQRAEVPLPKPGWTLADMRDAAEKLHAAGIQAIGFEQSFRTLPPFVWTNGGEVVDSTAKPTKITLGTMAARGALTYLKDLLPLGVDATEQAADPAEERFARGEVAMFLDSRRAVPKFRKSENLTFDVAPLPVGAAPATLLASDAYCVAKASSDVGTAQAFARYAVGPDGGQILADAGRTVPSNKALAQGTAFLAPDKQPRTSKVWLDVIPHLRRLPSVGPWNEAEEGANDVLQQFFAGKLSLDATITRIEADSTIVLAKGG